MYICIAHIKWIKAVNCYILRPSSPSFFLPSFLPHLLGVRHFNIFISFYFLFLFLSRIIHIFKKKHYHDIIVSYENHSVLYICETTLYWTISLNGLICENESKTSSGSRHYVVAFNMIIKSSSTTAHHSLMNALLLEYVKCYRQRQLQHTRQNSTPLFLSYKDNNKVFCCLSGCFYSYSCCFIAAAVTTAMAITKQQQSLQVLQ